MSDENENEAGEKAESPQNLFGFLAADLVRRMNAGQSPQVDEAIAQVEKRLGSKAAREAFLDHLRTGRRAMMVPMSSVEKLRKFSDEAGPDLVASLALDGSLRAAVEDWSLGKTQAAVDWCVRETAVRIGKADETLLSRHQISFWVLNALCFCRQCSLD